MREISAIGHIRQNLDFYFQNGTATAEALTNLVVLDVLEAGASDIQIKLDGGFVGVSADVDWMRSQVADFDALFRRIVPSCKRQNGFRAEVVLMAVSSGLLAFGHGPTFQANLLELDIPLSLRNMNGADRRVLVWRFDGELM
jgi:hypothetical protein